MQAGFSKGTISSGSMSFWEKAAPPALHLKPDNSVPPHISLESFRLLLWCWSSEQVSPSASKSMYSPFKKSTWDSSCPLSHSATIPAGFHSQKLWGFLFPPLESWAEEPGMRLRPPCSSGRPPQLIYPSYSLTTTIGCGPSHSMFLSLLLVSRWLLPYILSYRISVQLTSGDSQ